MRLTKRIHELILNFSIKIKVDNIHIHLHIHVPAPTIVDKIYDDEVNKYMTEVGT